MSYVPLIDPSFCENETSELIKKVINAGRFFPVILYGETGVGKTFPVVQTCALLGRECLRVNLSKRSNEDNLIGGFRLNNGSTYYEKGPIILAMERGAILLLDEMDAADPEEILCLQSVLEGNGYYIKNINEQIVPAPGFTIFATANTKGLGDETGKYVGTNILNEAFLERFVMVLTVSYPSIEEERKILTENAKTLGIKCDRFIDKLVNWAALVRTTIVQKPSDFSHNISTRRLIHIISAFLLFRDEKIAIFNGINRFDDYHRNAFMDIYNAMHVTKENFISIHQKEFEKLTPL